MPISSSAWTAFATCRGYRSQSVPSATASCGDAWVMPVMRAALPAVEHRGVLGDGEPARGIVERGEVDILGAAVAVGQLRPRHRERRAELHQRQDTALGGVQPAAGRLGDPVDAAEVGGRVLPAVRPEKSIRRRAASAGVSRSRASSSIRDHRPR